MQNHLMQVLSILAMEPPVQVVGENAANYIRGKRFNNLFQESHHNSVHGDIRRQS
jgi:glucose-6-phosphate 1-dehydrogenase